MYAVRYACLKEWKQTRFLVIVLLRKFRNTIRVRMGKNNAEIFIAGEFGHTR